MQDKFMLMELLVSHREPDRPCWTLESTILGSDNHEGLDEDEEAGFVCVGNDYSNEKARWLDYGPVVVIGDYWVGTFQFVGRLCCSALKTL